jgi:hypothetical protein
VALLFFFAKVSGTEIYHHAEMSGFFLHVTKRVRIIDSIDQDEADACMHVKRVG